MIVHALLKQGLQEETLVPWAIWGGGGGAGSTMVKNVWDTMD